LQQQRQPQQTTIAATTTTNNNSNNKKDQYNNHNNHNNTKNRNIFPIEQRCLKQNASLDHLKIVQGSEGCERLHPVSTLAPMGAGDFFSDLMGDLKW